MTRYAITHLQKDGLRAFLQHPWLVRGVWLCLAGWCMGCWWLLLRWVVWMTFHW